MKRASLRTLSRLREMERRSARVNLAAALAAEQKISDLQAMIRAKITDELSTGTRWDFAQEAASPAIWLSQNRDALANADSAHAAAQAVSGRAVAALAKSQSALDLTTTALGHWDTTKRQERMNREELEMQELWRNPADR
jgi:hypothetical protein